MKKRIPKIETLPNFNDGTLGKSSDPSYNPCISDISNQNTKTIQLLSATSNINIEIISGHGYVNLLLNLLCNEP